MSQSWGKASFGGGSQSQSTRGGRLQAKQEAKSLWIRSPHSALSGLCDLLLDDADFTPAPLIKPAVQWAEEDDDGLKVGVWPFDFWLDLQTRLVPRPVANPTAKKFKAAPQKKFLKLPPLCFSHFCHVISGQS